MPTSPSLHSTQRCGARHTPGHPSTSPGRLGTALAVGKHNPCGLTWVILITSLTNAIAFSGWNLQVPFCGDRRKRCQSLLGTLLCRRRNASELRWKYLGPVRVGVLPHEPFVIQYVFKGLAWQAPARQHSQQAD